MTKSSATPARRDMSPVKLPAAKAVPRLEDEEMTTVPEDQHSSPAPSERDDIESHSGVVANVSASAPSPPEEAAADTTGDISDAAVHTRCVVNFLDPRPGECGSRITNDDRHYISNFFGRNKSCSTSIPEEFYQVLCRKCMQAMKYRLKSGKGASEIQVQVAAIKHALRNMAASKRWVFVEVQLTKTEYDRRRNPKKYDEEIRKFNEDIFKSREEAKQKGEKARRRNTKKALPPVPDWLAEQVVRSDDNPDQDYTPVHERDPTRWSFEDLIALVDVIGENCDVLPNIECLVVTQGELDRVNLEDAKMLRREARRELQLLRRDVTRTEESLKQDPKNQTIQSELQDYEDRTSFMENRLEDAEEEVKKASEILEKTAHTIPPKREQVKKPGLTKGESSKSAMKKGKTKKSKTKHDHSQMTITEPDIEPEVRPRAPSDVGNLAAASPTPPPGWKGKEKAQTTPEPSTPPRQTHEETPAAASVPSTPPAQALTVAALVTPNQPTSATSPSSTTRSTGRRIQLVAERNQGQQLSPQGQQGQQGQKRKAVAEEDEGQQQQQQQHSGVGATEQGSPRLKKVKRASSKD